MQLDELQYSDVYADYILANCGGDRLICNGDMLLDAMESLYLFPEFCNSVGVDDD